MYYKNKGDLGWARFFKNGIYFIKINSQAFFLLTFFISITVFSSWLDGLARDLNGVKPGVTLESREMQRLLPEEVREVVMELAIQHQHLAREPYIDKNTGEIIPERNGWVIDIDKTVNQVLLANNNDHLKMVRIMVPAQHSHQELASLDQVQGYYETWLRGDYKRYTNISLAAQAVNNTLLWPQEVFSFNEVVGPRTPERGYLPAPVILMGGTEPGYGGGVCQVSSTLFNAASQAGFKIVERHQHSKPVSYVPPGKDATVNYGSLDLKFANTFNNPVIIKAGVSNGLVWVRIMGGEKK